MMVRVVFVVAIMMVVVNSNHYVDIGDGDNDTVMVREYDWSLKERDMAIELHTCRI